MKIKGWLHWNWEKEQPFMDSPEDGALIWFDEDNGEEHSALPVEIIVTEDGMKDIIRERQIRKAESLDESN